MQTTCSRGRTRATLRVAWPSGIRLRMHARTGVTPEMARQEAAFKEDQEAANDAALEPPIDTQSTYQRDMDE